MLRYFWPIRELVKRSRDDLDLKFQRSVNYAENYIYKIGSCFHDKLLGERAHTTFKFFDILTFNVRGATLKIRYSRLQQRIPLPLMGKIKKSISRWFWGMLMADKLSIYNTKCPFWPQNLIFRTNGCPEQFEKCMKKHLNLHKSLTKALNAFGSALKVERAFLLLLRSLSKGLKPTINLFS